MILKKSYLLYLLILTAIVGIAQQSSQLLWLTQNQSSLIESNQSITQPSNSLDKLQFQNNSKVKASLTEPINWTVQGIYFEENNESVAIIQTANGIFNVEEGDTIEDVIIRDITIDTVIIDNDGSEQTFILPYNELQTVSDNIDTPTKVVINLADLAKINQSPQQLLSEIELKNTHHMGLPAIKLNSKQAKNTFLTLFSLQNNDEILEVNKQTANPKILIDLLLNVEKNKIISAKIKRFDKIMEFTYSFR